MPRDFFYLELESDMRAQNALNFSLLAFLRPSTPPPPFFLVRILT